nr:DoxX family membrane protein [Flavobacterium indicum]
MMNAFALLLLAFLAITFLQSGLDKIMDWNGNVSWLKSHFSQTILKNNVPAALLIVLALEIVAGVLAVMGIIENITSHSTQLGDYACMVSCVTLLFLLFGQRLAKDYDGARTIVIYFIPAILGVYWL